MVAGWGTNIGELYSAALAGAESLRGGGRSLDEVDVGREVGIPVSVDFGRHGWSKLKLRCFDDDDGEAVDCPRDGGAKLEEDERSKDSGSHSKST